VRKRADFIWSLSKLTFLHEWARMLVLEQLYRAAKIAHSEPYHH
jgi:23S rRNA (pseudouridine1915-N3)-methyltransferase